MSLSPEMDMQLSDLPSTSVPDPVELPNSIRRSPRNHVACDACHIRRVRCDLVSPRPCSNCLLKSLHCGITRKQQKRGRRARSEVAHTEVYAPLGCNNGSQVDDKRSPVSLPAMSTTGFTPTPASVTQSLSPETNEIDTLLALCSEYCSSVPNSSQAAAEPEVHIADKWLSTIDLSRNLPDLSAEDDRPLSSLSGNWKPVNMTPNIPSQISPMILSSPATNRLGQEHDPSTSPPLKYPVLKAVMPILETNLSPQLVCHLLELYFTCTFPNQLHMVYRHFPCYILRKRAFLTDEFRPTSPALLTSMLWTAALDDRAFSLSVSSSQKSKTCQFLGNLTRTLLRGSDFEGPSLAEFGSPSTAGHLDRVITYIHIASIFSTGQIASSTTWWNAAFALARQLKLNQEVENAPYVNNQTNQAFCQGLVLDRPNEPTHFHYEEAQPILDCICEEIHDPSYLALTQEHHEERRRTWWLLYIMDHHFALSEKRLPHLLDAECENLLLPLNEASWQDGVVHNDRFSRPGPRCVHSKHQIEHQIFPDFRCHDSSFFGFFLPLMAIAGEISRLKYGPLQCDEAYEIQETEIRRHLEIYQTSLITLGASPAPLIVDPEVSDQLVNAQPSQDYAWQTQTVIAYSSYLAHVFHILLAGKCDWLFLMEDQEFWTSPVYASTILHIIDAAFSLQQILKFDPDISFMPYFFGVQLFQGSLPALLIVERLQQRSGEDLLSACEIIIQATESCIVTQSTFYLRMFRQLLRSAVSQAWGRPMSADEIRHRRKAVFALWLWTRKGTNWPAEFDIPCQA